MSDAGRIQVNLQDLRKPYHNEVEPILHESYMDVNPMVQFDSWFKGLVSYTLSHAEINAVALSTVSGNRPSSRMVLMKEYSSDGFIFYTNAVSRKAREFSENPNAAMLFYWPAADRQVRVEGRIEKLDPALADQYWATRPLSSRIGSKLSPQSAIIPDRAFLERRREELERAVDENGPEAITRPESWLGFLLRPIYFEFWQGQSNRIHDRLVYEPDSSSPVGQGRKWTMRRLAP